MGAFDNFDPNDPNKQAGAFDNFVPPSSNGRPVGALPAGASAAGTPAGQNQPVPDSGNWIPANRAELMNRLSRPFQGAGQAADDYVRAVTDAASFGTADRLASAMPTWLGGTGRTLEQERAETEAAKARLGLMAPVAAGVGYMSNPVSDISAGASGIGNLLLRGAVEGGVAGAASGAGHGRDPLVDAALGAGTAPLAALGASAITAPIAGTMSKIAASKLAPVPGTTDLQTVKNAAFDALHDYQYPRASVSELNDAVQAAARRTGLTELGTPGAYEFYKDFDSFARNGQPISNWEANYAAKTASTPEEQAALAQMPDSDTGPVSMQTLRDIKKQAYSRSAPNTVYGDIFKQGVDRLFNNVDPIGSSAEEASDALASANVANSNFKNSQLMDEWARNAETGGQPVAKQAGSYLRSDEGQRYLTDDQEQALKTLAQGTPLRNVSDFMAAHSYHLGKALGFGALGALGGHAFGAEGWPLMEIGVGTMLGYPAVRWAGSGVSNWANAPLIDAARRSMVGAEPRVPVEPSAANAALRSLIFGGATGY